MSVMGISWQSFDSVVRFTNQPALNLNRPTSKCFDSAADWVSAVEQIVTSNFSRRHCIDSDEIVFVGEPIPIAQRHSCVVESRHISVIYELFVITQVHISVGRVVLALAWQWVAVKVRDNFYSFMQASKAFLGFRRQFDGNRKLRHLDGRLSKCLRVRTSS